MPTMGCYADTGLSPRPLTEREQSKGPEPSKNGVVGCVVFAIDKDLAVLSSPSATKQ